MDEKKEVGRPRIFDTPEQFDAKVQEYYNNCIESNEPVTWTGLALYLGFSSRQSIDEYQKYKGFSDSVKRAKLLVELAYEKRLLGNNATGPIFVLKNMGWSDKQELDVTQKSTVKVSADMSPQEAAKAYQDLMNG